MQLASILNLHYSVLHTLSYFNHDCLLPSTGDMYVLVTRFSINTRTNTSIGQYYHTYTYTYTYAGVGVHTVLAGDCRDVPLIL